MRTSSELYEYVRQVGRQLCAELETVRTQSATPDFQSSVSQIMQRSLDTLAATGCTGSANQLPSSELWRVAETTLRDGSLQLHARQKPLGYPGDHQLLDRICREDVRGQSVGRAMDVFFQNHAAPQAVRNRGRETAATIGRAVRATPGRLKVVSFGCGPAWDIRWSVESMSDDQRERLDVTLVDLDPKALAFCEQQLAPLMPSDNLCLLRANLKRLPRLQPVINQMAGSDIVCCPGYFDYLDDTEAVTMLQSLWNCVAKHGELLIFNFAKNNPSRAYMEWIGNWYLNYRTTESMERLATTAGLAGGAAEFGVEPVGVNLFLRVRKN